MPEPQVRPRTSRGKGGRPVTRRAKGRPKRSTSPKPLVDLRKVEKEIFQRTNAKRADPGNRMKPLVALTKAARGHAEWLAKKKNPLALKDPHKGRKGSTVVDRVPIENCGPSENIGFVHVYDPASRGKRKRTAQTLARVAMKAWWKSPGHKKNLVNSNLRFLGVGAAIWKRGSKASWRIVLVQNFSENSGAADRARQHKKRGVVVFE